MFVHAYRLSAGGIDYNSDDSYYGSAAAEDGGGGDWGCMDALVIYRYGEEGVPDEYYTYPHDERGFIDGSRGHNLSMTAEEFAAEQRKYSEVRDLVVSDGASVEVPAP